MWNVSEELLHVRSGWPPKSSLPPAVLPTSLSNTLAPPPAHPLTPFSSSSLLRLLPLSLSLDCLSTTSPPPCLVTYSHLRRLNHLTQPRPLPQVKYFISDWNGKAATGELDRAPLQIASNFFHFNVTNIEHLGSAVCVNDASPPPLSPFTPPHPPSQPPDPPIQPPRPPVIPPLLCDPSVNPECAPASLNPEP